LAEVNAMDSERTRLTQGITRLSRARVEPLSLGAARAIAQGLEQA
jgi:hypothetical protein